jgi:hypothetical protein
MSVISPGNSLSSSSSCTKRTASSRSAKSLARIDLPAAIFPHKKISFARARIADTKSRLRNFYLSDQQFVNSVSIRAVQYALERFILFPTIAAEFFSKQAGFNKDLRLGDRGFEQIVKFGGTVLPAA